MSKIYGIEPNLDHHRKLRQRIKEAGLEDVYVIIPLGVEDFGSWKGIGGVKLAKGEVDSVVTVFCAVFPSRRG